MTVENDAVQQDDTDLNDFENEFFGRTPKAEVEEEADEPVEQNDENEGDPEDNSEEPDAEQEDDEDSEEEQKPRNRKTAKERIRELTARAKEAERREQETLRRLDALEGKSKPRETEQKAPEAPDPDATKDDGSPVYPLGEFDPQYVRDMARHVLKQENEAAAEYRRQAEEEQALERQRSERQAGWMDKLNEAEKESPDIKEKISDLNETFSGIDQNYGQYLVDVIMTLDNGPKVLEYLSDNIEEAQKIVRSGAASATVALGRLDQRMVKPEPTKKKVTNTTAPPERVTRGTGGRFAVTDDTDDLEAFERKFFKRK